MVGETIFVSAPLIMFFNFGFDTFSTAILLSLISLVVVPISLLIDKAFKDIQERKIIITLSILSLLSCIILISYPFLEITLSRYIIFATILFSAANVIESFTSALLAKIYPPQLAKVGSCNAGFTIIFSTSGGKFIGGCLVTFLSMIGDSMPLLNKIFLFYTILFILIMISVYTKYNDLRVKAIARIIQRKNIGNNI